MNKNGVVIKSVYCNTEEGVTTQIQIQYNTHTNHITFGFTQFKKSPGWTNGSVNNKQCASYLGVTVAESVLSKIFQHVERMPYGNPGYDFICGRGYRIDIKSATRMKNQNAWVFHIGCNYIADYFLCLAFDNREDLNPLHLWLIPAKKVNHLTGLIISESKLKNWSQYELDGKLNKVIACCNVLREM